MFDRLLFWLREKARLLFGENTTVSASVSNSMENAIILWAQMYDTGGPWCHGGKNALHSLKLAQSVASELARLTTLEMECIVSGSARADSINTMLQPFIADLRTPVEYGCALGGILFRPFLDAEGRIQIDAVQGDCFCPTRFDSSGRMTGAIFYDHKITQKLERMVRMMAMLWAQEIMSCETTEEAKAMYARCPRLLKEKVKAILIKSGFEEITQ